jgi:hypothetical protein
MLEIRQEQIERLSEAASKNFEDRMLVRLEKFFPQHFTALGEEKTRFLVQFGVERAKTYSIASERDVCKYIDLMVSFGVEFDTDPKLPWASQILNDPSLKNPRLKTDTLFKAGLDHLAHQ